jgi:hypothetical protein
VPLQAPPIVVDATSRIRRPIPPKELLWPTVGWLGNIGAGADSSRFPGLRAIKERHAARPAEALETFLRAIRDAQDRVLVMDDFLFRDDNGGGFRARLMQVMSWLPDTLAAQDVRFLTAAPPTQTERREIEQTLAARERAINGWVRRQAGMTIQVRFSLRREFPYVHDRFAIVDDDLWHFGATVGGLHHQVNAVSHGWNIEDHDAVNFFNLAWAGDPDAGVNHGRRNRRR